MALHLYRRHRRDCAAKRPYDSRSGELDEHRKGWKRCECLIYVSGTLAGAFDRRSTDATTWEKAHTFVRPLEDAGSWNGQPRPEIIRPTSDAPALSHSQTVVMAPVSAPAPTNPDRIAIAKAIEGFLATKAVTVAFSTLRKHRTFTKQLQAFADNRGYVMLDQFRPLDIDTFYAGSNRRATARHYQSLRSG